LTWSLELYQQTNARLWRQGQQAETVVIHHIVTENTIDEQILQALEKKDRSQESLIDAVKVQIGERKGAA
jgi:SNF2 family DNA or RNA helicase